MKDYERELLLEKGRYITISFVILLGKELGGGGMLIILTCSLWLNYEGCIMQVNVVELKAYWRYLYLWQLPAYNPCLAMDQSSYLSVDFMENPENPWEPREKPSKHGRDQLQCQCSQWAKCRRAANHTPKTFCTCDAFLNN